MQTIFYNPPKTNFSVIPNRLIQDDELSNNAKMTALMLLSLPKDFKINGAYLAKRLNFSLRSLQRAFKELIEAGYLIKSQAKNDDGSFNKFNVFVFIDENTKEFCENLNENSQDENLEEAKNVCENESDFKQLKQEQEEDLKADFTDTLQNENPKTRRLEANCNLQSKQKGTSNHCAKKPPADFCHPYKEINLDTKKEKFYTLAFLKKNLLIAFTNQRQVKQVCLNYEGLSESELNALEAFFEYRKEKNRGKALTLSTKNAILKKCKDFKNRGFAVESIVNKSIENGWVGLFEPKQSQKSFKIKGENKFLISKQIVNEIVKFNPNFEVFEPKAVENLKIGGKKVLYDETTCLYSLEA